MQSQQARPQAELQYSEKYNSTFYGLLYWPELDTFWIIFKQQLDTEWFIYDLNAAPPEVPVSQSEMNSFIATMDGWLQTHAEDYCGVVYVDDTLNPSFVKIFHPKKMGYGTCSLSKERPFPGWILSTQKPVDIHPKQPERPSWWKSLPFLSNQL